MKHTVIWLAAICFVFTGCGKKANEKLAEKMIEAAAKRDGIKADVNIADDTFTIKTDDGTSTFSAGKNAKVPADFPKDVYVYEGAEVVSSVSGPDGFSLMFQTKDAQAKVANTMKSKFASQGWTEEMTMNQGGVVMLGYKKDERSVIVNVTGDSDMTQISLTVALNNQ